MRIAKARMEGVSITRTQADNIKRLAYEQALGTAQIKASADAQTIASAASVMGAGAAAEFTAVQTRLAEARRNGQALTQQEIDDLKHEAAVLGVVTQAAAEFKAQNDATFSLQTALLSSTDQQIASIQRQLHGDAWQQFMNDGLSVTMRLAVALKPKPAANGEPAAKAANDNKHPEKRDEQRPSPRAA